MDVLSAHEAAHLEYKQALDAYVQVVTAIDVIDKVRELTANHDHSNLEVWMQVLDSKAGKLKDVAALLKEYYTKSYKAQFSVGHHHRSVTEAAFK